MFALDAGESIKKCCQSAQIASSNAPRCCQATECTRVAHRGIVIESANLTRTTVLCGMHFLEACSYCPDLQVAEWALLSHLVRLKHAM